MAAGDVNTSSGSKLYIGTTAANPVGDSYIEITEIQNMGDFGRMYEQINYSTLGDRNVRKFKGQRDDGNMELELGRKANDPGQAAMIVALDTDQDYNFKATLNDDTDTTGSTPTTVYFKAKVMGYRTNVGGPNQVVGARTTIGIKSGSLVEVAAA